ncbi:MAG: Sir2 family NAD-dependent protein deacetylase, partial [Terriglobales bacterium]
MDRVVLLPEDRVFVLTGAGTSAESGLPTFRAEDGLWAGSRIEDVCTPEAWQRNPAEVWKFYAARREAGAKAGPNAAH